MEHPYMPPPTCSHHLEQLMFLSFSELLNPAVCPGSTCRSCSRAGEWGRRGVECPELGGEGEARVEDVMEVGMKPRPVPSLPREDGGIGGLSRATLTRFSISSARSSVFSFSSWISLVGFIQVLVQISREISSSKVRITIIESRTRQQNHDWVWVDGSEADTFLT